LTRTKNLKLFWEPRLSILDVINQYFSYKRIVLINVSPQRQFRFTSPMLAFICKYRSLSSYQQTTWLF
jgi:hypothetical protein